MKRTAWMLTAAWFTGCLASEPVRPDGPEVSRAQVVTTEQADSQFEVTRIWSIGQEAIGMGYVHRCHPLSDVDGDGVLELALQVEIDWNTSRVYVLSGATGAWLYTLECPAERHFNCTLGSTLRQLGDLDGDGVADFAVGDPSGHPLNGQNPPFTVLIVSARTGTVLQTFVEREATGYGSSLLASQDLDGDSLGDLLVRSWEGPEGVIDALSSKSGARIWRTRPAHEFGRVSPRLLACDDVTGDGVPEFIDLTFDARRAESLATVYSGSNGAPIEVDTAIVDAWRARDVGPLYANSDIDGDGVKDFVRLAQAHGELLFVYDLDQDGVADFVFANASAEVGVESWRARKRGRTAPLEATRRNGAPARFELQSVWEVSPLRSNTWFTAPARRVLRTHGKTNPQSARRGSRARRSRRSRSRPRRHLPLHGDLGRRIDRHLRRPRNALRTRSHDGNRRHRPPLSRSADRRCRRRRRRGLLRSRAGRGPRLGANRLGSRRERSGGMGEFAA